MDSMTGIGRARAKIGSSFILLEIKSINHRYCDVHTRLSSRFQTFEHEITQIVKKRIVRGKIDVGLYEERGDTPFSINHAALKNYHHFLKTIHKELGLTTPLAMEHIQNGSSFWMARDFDSKKYWPQIKKMLELALTGLTTMRQKEGRILKNQIVARIKKIEGLRDQVMQRKEEILLLVKDKFEKRMTKFLGGMEVDPAKIASEAAFYADRSDISEELDRLASHGKQMHDMLESTRSQGRSLDFLIQEMNREWNTIASKGQDASIAHMVVAAKSELEKIREQVQNIE